MQLIKKNSSSADANRCQRKSQKLEISRCISSRNDKQSCKNFLKNDQPILSLYTKNIWEYQIAISEKGHWWKTNFRLMCYLGGSTKLSKKFTFKFVPIRNGIEGLAATCDRAPFIRLPTMAWIEFWKKIRFFYADGAGASGFKNGSKKRTP